MKMPRHTDEDKARFRGLVPDAPGVEVKPMFGSLGAFVNGNMFAGLFGTDVGVKLDDRDRAELAGIEGAGPFGPPGRPMGGYVSMPASFSSDQARKWMERAREHVATFPPMVRPPWMR